MRSKIGKHERNKRSSETSVHTRYTRRHIPEDYILNSHRRENLKSYMKETDYLRDTGAVKVILKWILQLMYEGVN
jgi:hypothetical protein